MLQKIPSTINCHRFFFVFFFNFAQSKCPLYVCESLTSRNIRITDWAQWNAFSHLTVVQCSPGKTLARCLHVGVIGHECARNIECRSITFLHSAALLPDARGFGQHTVTEMFRISLKKIREKMTQR